MSTTVGGFYSLISCILKQQLEKMLDLSLDLALENS
jgi:hypothetical protein